MSARKMPAAEKERRSLRRWLRGRVRNAEELASTYREDGAVHTAAKQEGRAEAFKAVLLVLDADDRKAGRA